MNNIISSDELEFEKSLNILQNHMRNKLHFRANPNLKISGVSISEDFSTKGFRMSKIYNCTVKYSDFTEIGLAGSSFVDVKFHNTTLDSANFQSSNFENCYFFYNTVQKVVAVKFLKSRFSNCEFRNIEFHSANFCDCIFENVSFINCKFVSVGFENALFRDVTLSKLKFRSQNFDFAIFEKVHFIDSALPFPSVPFIINGFKLLIESRDSIEISSYAEKIKSKNRISKEEYLLLLPHFENYYKGTNSYFPLSNVYLATGKFNKAFNSILLGINQSLKEKNFRLIKYYINLLNYSIDINYTFKKNLYDQIMRNIQKSELTQRDLDNLNMYLGDIRQSLLNNTMNPTIELFFKTDIQGDDYEKNQIFLSIIDSIIKPFSDEVIYSVEMRHNSPTEYFILIIFIAFNHDNAESVIYTLTLILAILEGIFCFGNKLLKIIDLVLNDIDKYYEVKLKKLEYLNKSQKQIIDDNKKKLEKEKINIIESNVNVFNFSNKEEND